MKALGEFLNEHELGVPADLVYVVTAIHQPPGSPLPAVQVLWKHDEIQLGNDCGHRRRSPTDCARHVDTGNVAKLPAGFDMLENEVVIISEVCARLTVQGSLTGTFVDRRHLPRARAAVPRFQPDPGSAGLNRVR